MSKIDQVSPRKPDNVGTEALNPDELANLGMISRRDAKLYGGALKNNADPSDVAGTIKERLNDEYDATLRSAQTGQGGLLRVLLGRRAKK